MSVQFSLIVCFSKHNGPELARNWYNARFIGLVVSLFAEKCLMNHESFSPTYTALKDSRGMHKPVNQL